MNKTICNNHFIYIYFMYIYYSAKVFEVHNTVVVFTKALWTYFKIINSKCIIHLPLDHICDDLP